MLRHLAAVHILDVSHDDAVFKGRFVEQACRNRQKGIEPAAGLVDRFRNEIRGVACFKNLFVFKGIMPLCERHGSGIEPAVQNDRLALHDLTAFRTDYLHLIDIRLVQFDIVRAVPAHLFQLFPAPDHMRAAAFAGPYRERRSPVAFAAESPVDHALEEIAHPAFLDIVRDPVDAPVEPDQLILDRRHFNEPALAGIIDQRRVAAPAERIAVFKRKRCEQRPLLFQIFQDLRIRILHKHPVERRSAAHAAPGINQLQERKIVRLADAVVVFTERQRDVHDSGSGIQRYVIIRDDSVTGLASEVHREVKQRPVGLSDQLRAKDFLQDLDVVAENLPDQRFREQVFGSVLLDIRIFKIRVYAESRIGGKRPRSRGPRQDRNIRFLIQIELGDGGSFLNVLVSLRHLVACQGGPAAGAVRHDLIALIQETLLMDLLERPPLRFDVIVVVGDIGILHVRPESDPVRHVLPFGLVLPDRFLALFHEGLDTILFDLLLSVQPEVALHLQLDRKAMGIPAGFSQHVVPFHGPVTRDQILDRPGFDMTDVRASVRRRRSVEKRIGRCFFPEFHALFKHLVFLPEIQNLLFSGHKVHVRRYFSVHSVSSIDQ